MTKPIGSLCNLDCKYCFYLEKENLYPDTRNFRMPRPVLEAYVRHYIESQPADAPEIPFAWQGGEPTLLGIPFFEEVVELQRRYASGRKVSNAFQTNGSLLNDDWGRFLHDNGFLVGLSIDGPRDLHDAYRVDKGQRPTFDRVMRGLEVLHRHKVEFNTLTTVHRENSRRPLDVYRFLRSIGSGFIQFIPIVERKAGSAESSLGLWLAGPPDPANPGGTTRAPGNEDSDAENQVVTAWSVRAERYGEFLCTIFDEWVSRDVGNVFIQIVDVTLGNFMNLGSGLCVFSERCGAALALEHNGDLYSCDHYVYPKYRLGNLLSQPLGQMVDSAFQQGFGNAKADALPPYCRSCEVRFACHGECPKHRFIRTPDGDPGLNYLCPAYKRFFRHVAPAMRTMESLLRAGHPAAAIMQIPKSRWLPGGLPGTATK